jgi:hypothetical protein
VGKGEGDVDEKWCRVAASGFMASGMNIVRRFKRKKVLLEWIVEELALELGY